MATYLVERYLPGLGVEELVLTAAGVPSVTADLAAAGTAIRYLGSTLVPADEALLGAMRDAPQRSLQRTPARPEARKHAAAAGSISRRSGLC